MQGHVLNPLFPAKTACLTKGLLVTDAKNLYDKLDRATVRVKGAEKRSDIAISLREHAEASNVHKAWVHGGTMIANGQMDGVDSPSRRLHRCLSSKAHLQISTLEN